MLESGIGSNTAPFFRVSSRAKGETRRTTRIVSNYLLQSGSFSALNYPSTRGGYRRNVQSTEREGDSVVL